MASDIAHRSQTGKTENIFSIIMIIYKLKVNVAK